MTLTIESATFISDLNAANPGSNDLKSEGDDHVRLVKNTLKTTFPYITGAVTLTHTQLNALGPGGAATYTAITTTTGNAILGSTAASTLNVGAGGLIKDASGNVGIGATPTTRLTVQSAGSAASAPTNISALTGSVRMIGTIAGAAFDGLTYQSGGGGGAGVVFSRGTSFDTAVQVFTNNSVGVAGGLANFVTFDSLGNTLPGVTATQSLGLTGSRWSAVYGVVGNFSGTVTAAAFSGALSGPISQFTNDAGYATSAGIIAAAGSLTGSSLAANVVNSSLTSIAPSATDGTYELGFKGLPAASITTGSFVASDKGKCVYATGGVTIPNSTMATGDVVTILNTTGSPITLTAGIGTLRQAGTGNVGSRTLATFGIASVLFQSSVIAYVSGVGLT